MTATPSEPANIQQRIAIAQIDAVFNAVPVGVSAAAIAGIFLAAGLSSLGYADPRIAAVWALWVSSCALCHLLLYRAHREARPQGDRWRRWAFLFTLICFGEGIGWGWAPIGLATGGRLDVEFLVLMVSVVIAEGAMVAFGPYLPAFFALFIPATLPYLLASAGSQNTLERATFPLMLVFIIGLGALAVTTNRSFKQLVGLRIRTQQLALDLQKQKEIAERQREIAEQANLAKSTFLAAASHDLRQPVHALGIFVGALRGIALPAEASRIVEQIEASTTAMDGLFSALLDISRLDAGVVPVQRRAFAIKPLLDRICRDHRQDAIAKGLSLVCGPCSAIVATDPLLLERILRNLVSNAVRYTDRGRIVIGCRRRGANVSVEVWDTGRGIALDQQDRVFQEYVQIGNPERDRTKGLGLGLAIVRRLTELLGCPLTLHSEPGRGSCFAVAVPLAAERAEVAGVAPGPAMEAPARGLVVVVDDELAIRDATAALLTGWGHDVIAAPSGDEAVLQLSTCTLKPALILCDYRLRDGESGLAVIERLRSEYNEALPAILITGDTAADRLAEAQSSDVLLLHKPVSNGKLRAAIVNLTAAVPPGNVGETSAVK
jgi:signal transduction histidine kinase/CheY-like chemotaxis protein